MKAWGELGFCLAAGLGTLCFLGAACRSGEKTSSLVQPDKWWSIHPRPVYSRLEKVGTFQDWFDVYRLAEGTFAIYEPNQFEEALSYLVLGSEKAALVDTGTGIGDIRRAVEELTDLPVVVVLTHEHYDHVAGAWRFEEIVHLDSPAALTVLAAGRDNASLQKYIAGDYLWKPLPRDFDSRSPRKQARARPIARRSACSLIADSGERSQRSLARRIQSGHRRPISSRSPNG